MIIRRDISDIPILMQFPDTPVIGSSSRYFAKRHDLMTKNANRVLVLPILTIENQRSV